jgi:hypothetical protein
MKISFSDRADRPDFEQGAKNSFSNVVMSPRITIPDIAGINL